MPLLNPSGVISSPFFSDGFTVIRRGEVVNANGYGASSDQIIPGVRGIVQAEGKNETDRDEDATTNSNSILIITRFPLRGEAENREGEVSRQDRVLYQGDEYLVGAVNDYTAFGPGWVEARATTDTIQTRAPGEP